MRVKVGETIFDSVNEPIMIIFDEGEKELISSMSQEAKRFGSFPEDSTLLDREQFMIFNEE